MGLEEIAEEIRKCNKCGLCKGRANPVPGEGSPMAKIMLIGEAPGANEDETGRPFVGSAGKILRKTLGEVGLSESEIFIGNIVKCRPPNNRKPLIPEAETCASSYLERQIGLIRPKIIVPLGSTSFSYFARKYGLENRPVSLIVGEVYRLGGFTLIPNFHPAYVLYSRSIFPQFKSIFKKIRELACDI